jgi:hypothetical protein
MSLSHVDQLLLRGLEGTSDPNSLQYISREAAYQELRQRTGEDFGYDAEKWRDYLRQGARDSPVSKRHRS